MCYACRHEFCDMGILWALWECCHIASEREMDRYLVVDRSIVYFHHAGRLAGMFHDN